MQRIYFDNAATTRTIREAAMAAIEVMCEDYGNPSSLHEMGYWALQRLRKARLQVAEVLGADEGEVYFTSGGTEANHLAIVGTADAYQRRGKRIISVATEHSSVTNTLKYLAGKGFDVLLLPPDKNGGLDLESLSKVVDKQTILVTAGLINSEVGTISAISQSVKIVKKLNPSTLFHTDGVQAYGKIPISVRRMGIDLLSVSGHKLHAPKGVGALYIKEGVRINPTTHGGGQEKGMRSGTEGVPNIAAFGEASRIALENLNENLSRVTGLSRYFLGKAEKFLGIRINSGVESTPYICNISVPGYHAQVMLNYLAQQGVYVSSGSACSKGAKSHVLSAMGLSNQRIDSALRISFSRENTTEEIDQFFTLLKTAREELIRS